MSEIFVDFVQAPHLGTCLIKAEDPLEPSRVLFCLAERPELHLVGRRQGRAEVSGRALERKVLPLSSYCSVRSFLEKTGCVRENVNSFLLRVLCTRSLIVIGRSSQSVAFQNYNKVSGQSPHPGFFFCSS